MRRPVARRLSGIQAVFRYAGIMNADQDVIRETDGPVHARPSAVVHQNRFCIRCGYNIVGLSTDAACPECATQVALSLREPLLQSASPEYLRTVKRGLSLVLNGILLQIVVGVLVPAVAGGFGAAPAFVGLLLTGAQLVVSIMILIGYWFYTEPDPGQVALESTNSARKVVRWVVGVQAAVSLGGFLLTFLAESVSDADLVALLQALIGLATLAGLGIWLIQFFAVMRYTRWLATRVPDKKMIRHTKLYMWLLPAVSIIGAIALLLGPLIALILYWNLLHRLRTYLNKLLKTLPQPVPG